MTVIIGVNCTDGVVIGADSMATSAMGPERLIQLEVSNKLTVIERQIIVAATGAVGYTQRLLFHVEAARKGGVFKSPRHECFGNISRRLLTDFQNTMVPINSHSGFSYGALIACENGDKPFLVEYDTVNFQPEIKEHKLFFVSMGSGQQLADPFLAFVSRVLWKNTMPTVKEAKFGVHWALNHTIKLAPGGVGGPPKIATLEKHDGKWQANEVLDNQETNQHIELFETWIGDRARDGYPEAPGPIPEPPQPEKAT